MLGFRVTSKNCGPDIRLSDMRQCRSEVTVQNSIRMSDPTWIAGSDTLFTAAGARQVQTPRLTDLVLNAHRSNTVQTETILSKTVNNFECIDRAAQSRLSTFHATQ